MPSSEHPRRVIRRPRLPTTLQTRCSGLEPMSRCTLGNSAAHAVAMKQGIIPMKEHFSICGLCAQEFFAVPDRKLMKVMGARDPADRFTTPLAAQFTKHFGVTGFCLYACGLDRRSEEAGGARVVGEDAWSFRKALTVACLLKVRGPLQCLVRSVPIGAMAEDHNKVDTERRVVLWSVIAALTIAVTIALSFVLGNIQTQKVQ